jgi:redox-sensitive bicupin YhaK (pirin superfamily)
MIIMLKDKKFRGTFSSVQVDEGEGAKVRRLFPTRQLSYFDPFVLFDEFFIEKPSGFPTHQHRGFEFITYMLEGAIEHRDNMGNVRVVYAGGVQKANTGSGISHSEMPVEPGVNHGIQLWVNLPRNLKAVNPEYQYAEEKELPQIEDEGIMVRTIVGEGSPIRFHTSINYLEIVLAKGFEYEVVKKPEFNSLVYVISGSIEFGNVKVDTKKAAILNDEVSITTTSSEDSRFIFISGKPLNQPVQFRGPFVD